MTKWYEGHFYKVKSLEIFDIMKYKSCEILNKFFDQKLPLKSNQFLS